MTLIGKPAMREALCTVTAPGRTDSASTATGIVFGRRRPEAEATEAPESTSAISDDAPATRADVDRLAGLVAELVRREEARAAALARIEEGIGEVLADLSVIKDRLDG